MNKLRHLALLLLLSTGLSVYARTDPNEHNYSAKIHTSLQHVDTIVIRFEYKQSALVQKYTLETLDSIINILLRDSSISLSIDGFAYKDEGSDTICYYLSLNRILFIKTYILGRGVALNRINSTNAYGRSRQTYVNKDNNGRWVNCRAELRLTYPAPPKKKGFFDKDEDGIVDEEDKCPEIFGFSDFKGCPDSGTIVVPFSISDWSLTPVTYTVLDSVSKLLKDNPDLTISIDGHAQLTEGTYAVCMQLAAERTEIVKNYLLSRYIGRSRILNLTNYGISRPLNAAKNPQQILKNARAEIRVNSNKKAVVE